MAEVAAEVEAADMARDGGDDAEGDGASDG